MRAEDWIKHLQLLPHPEGGFYKETYRSEGFVKMESSPNGHLRNYSTGIYFLLVDNNFSAFHRIASDEMWHYYAGHTLELFEIDEDGVLLRTLIGIDISAGAVPQYVVKAGNWFASRVLSQQGFVLTGCTVSPGFDFHDFEMADRNELIVNYPQHAAEITALTRIG
jgi:predicted cupin superfamily sugar epimerase